jgi:predicted RND superfamily exporter protein
MVVGGGRRLRLARGRVDHSHSLGYRLIRHRSAVVLAVGVVTAFFGWRASQLRMATNLADLLPEHHPFVETYKQYGREFGGADSITVMIEAHEGTLFTAERLSQVFLVTQAIDGLESVNHHQVESMAHRTARRVRVGKRGTLRSEPLMLGLPKNDAQAADIRRAVHKSEAVFGNLVSLDDQAALVRANLRAGSQDYRELFDDVNARVLVPYARGWIGALFVKLEAERAPKLGLDPGIGLRIERLFPGSAAEKAGLKEGDVVILVNGATAREPWDVAGAVARAADEAVEIGYLRGGKPQTLTLGGGGSGLEVWVAGEPRLYGWIYHYAREIVWIFGAVAVFAWCLLYLYFHDWRGASRPLITGVVAAAWGLGFIELIGFALDPLTLVIPFFITARAVSHSVQMHDRYYQEFHENGYDKRRAIITSFDGLLIPTLSGIVTDAAGVLVLILVPIPLLQKLAVTAAFWICSITVAELLLNPIVYDFLRAPDPRIVQRRASGTFYRLLLKLAAGVLSPTGRVATLAFWIAVSAACATQWPKLKIGDADAMTPLVARDSAYNQAYTRIQARFGGIEPLIVVAEGFDKDAMKDPQALATIERFQRAMERDSAVSTSFSLTDLARSFNGIVHDLEPRWGALPETSADFATLFFLFFSGQPPAETAKYVSGDFQSAPVTFFARGHKGTDVARLVARAQDFIERNPMEKARFKLAGGLIGLLAAANEELARSDVAVNLLAYSAIFVVLVLTYRSLLSGVLMLLPLLVANLAVNAYLGWRGIGISLETLPVITVGVGFGVDFGLYLVSRTNENYLSSAHRFAPGQDAERVRASILEAMTSSGKAITFSAFTMIAAALFWTVSRIRIDAEMGLLLGIWMAISWAATLTLLPVMLALLRPQFIQRRIALRA